MIRSLSYSAASAPSACRFRCPAVVRCLLALLLTQTQRTAQCLTTAVRTAPYISSGLVANSELSYTLPSSFSDPYQRKITTENLQKLLISPLSAEPFTATATSVFVGQDVKVTVVILRNVINLFQNADAKPLREGSWIQRIQNGSGPTSTSFRPFIHVVIICQIRGCCRHFSGRIYSEFHLLVGSPIWMQVLPGHR